jgi:hypothetical protein
MVPDIPATSRARRLALGPIVAAALAAASCGTVEITPQEIARADAPEPVRSGSIETWRDAVVVMNDFLASDFRRTLPPGRFELDDAAGMRFVTDLGTWPIAVRCNWWGDLCLATGFTAQEREYGFVVGETDPERDRRVDNSFFCHDDASRKDARTVAHLTLHETTHVVWRRGTVGFWNGVAYYLEAIFLFRTNDHSAERRPRATGEEFAMYCMALDGPEMAATVARELVESHVREPRRLCEHGPFPDEELDAPIPGAGR